MYLLCCLSLETSINPFQGVRIIPSLPVWKRRFCIMKIAIRELVHTQEHGQDARKAGTALKLSSVFFFASIYVVYFFFFFHLCYSSSISLISVWRYVPVL